MLIDYCLMFYNCVHYVLLGDHVAVYPENSAESVNKIGELLNVNLDTVFTLTNTDGTSCKVIFLKVYF